jgi:hypothetical protein
MPNHFILRVGDGVNFKNGSKHSTWAVKSRYISFLENVKEGDILWFIENKKTGDLFTGKIIAVAEFVSKNKRDTGPLLSLTPTDDELGWDKLGKYYDVEIHYTNLYNLTDCKLFTGQKNQTTICEYDKIKEGLLLNLIVEYEYISKYSKITRTM